MFEKNKKSAYMHKDEVQLGKDYNKCIEECQEDLRTSRFMVEFQLREW